MVQFDDDWVPRAERMGVFTAADAYADGMTRSAVRHRLATGRWWRVAGAGLAHARERDSARLRAAAAGATWPDGVVCLTSAALLHGIPVPDDGHAHVVVPVARTRIGILVPHRLRLDRGDVMHVGRLAVTTRWRTIVDCLGRSTPGDALDLLAWASSRRLVDADRLGAWIDAHPRAWGNAGRRAALVRLGTGSMSAAEDLLHAILRRAGITGWRGGARLLEELGVAAVVDVWFPDVLLVVEADGRRAHRADRFQSDRTRQNALVGAGCTVLRYTWHDLTTRAAWVADQVREVHGRLVREKSG